MTFKQRLALTIAYLEFLAIFTMLLEKILRELSILEKDDLSSRIRWSFMLDCSFLTAVMVCVIYGIHQSDVQCVLAGILTHFYVTTQATIQLLSTILSKGLEKSRGRFLGCTLWWLCTTIFYIFYRDIKNQNFDRDPGNWKRTVSLLHGYFELTSSLWLAPHKILEILGYAKGDLPRFHWLSWMELAYLMLMAPFSVCLLYGIHKLRERLMTAYILYFTLYSAMLALQTIWVAIEFQDLSLPDILTCISSPIFIYVLIEFIKDIKRMNLDPTQRSTSTRFTSFFYDSSTDDSASRAFRESGHSQEEQVHKIAAARKTKNRRRRST